MNSRTSSDKSAAGAFAQQIRSDSLLHLRGAAEALLALSPMFRPLLQIRLVLDANIVQEELRWRLRRRVLPGARTALHEAIAAGVVVPFAPEFLETEIREHAAEIADQTDTSVADVFREWQKFRKLLHLYTPALDRRTAAVDPDDLPYVHTCLELGASAVYSRDPHLRQMGVPVVWVQIDTALRDYARAAAIRVTVAISANFAAGVGVATAMAAYEMLKAALQALRRLPLVVQLAIALATVVAILHPRSRAALAEAWNRLRNGVNVALPIVSALTAQWAEANQKEQIALNTVHGVLPPQRKRSALSHARTVCALAKQPLPLAELERRIRAEGYISRSHAFAGYLRKIIRASGQFVEVKRDVWALAS